MHFMRLSWKIAFLLKPKDCLQLALVFLSYLKLFNKNVHNSSVMYLSDLSLVSDIYKKQICSKQKKLKGKCSRIFISCICADMQSIKPTFKKGIPNVAQTIILRHKLHNTNAKNMLCILDVSHDLAFLNYVCCIIRHIILNHKGLRKIISVGFSGTIFGINIHALNFYQLFHLMLMLSKTNYLTEQFDIRQPSMTCATHNQTIYILL